MASEEKKPKRKYGQKWAELSNSQADISAVYKKIIGDFPSLPDEPRVADIEELNPSADKMSPGSKRPQGQVVPPVKTSRRTLSPGTISPQGQNDPTDKMSTGIISSTEETSTGYLKLPNLIADHLMKILDSSEFTVYLRLYRLSHGFHQTTCLVGYKALGESCNLSDRQVRRIIPSLVSRKLIRIIDTYNEATRQGTLYEVLLVDNLSPGSKRPQGQIAQQDKMSNNKDHDQEDLKKKDHHQSAHAREVTTTYQTITGNSWTKADQAAYEKIREVPAEQIAATLRAVMQRAPQKPASLAYFVKEILNPTQANPANQRAVKSQIKAIVDQLKREKGGRGYLITDLEADTRAQCEEQGIEFSKPIFSEIVG